MTWGIDEQPRAVYDIFRKGEAKAIVRHVGGLENARVIAGGLAERSGHDHRVENKDGEVVHDALAPEKPGGEG